MQSVEQYYPIKLNIRELLLLKGCSDIHFFADTEELCQLWVPGTRYRMGIGQDLAADVLKKYPGGDWHELWERLEAANKGEG